MGGGKSVDWSAAVTLSVTSVPHPNLPLKKGRAQSPWIVVPAKAGTQTAAPHKGVSKLSAQPHGLVSRSTVLRTGFAGMTNV